MDQLYTPKTLFLQHNISSMSEDLAVPVKQLVIMILNSKKKNPIPSTHIYQHYYCIDSCVDLQISFSTPSWKIRKITDHMVEWCNRFPKLYTTNSASTNVVSFQNQNMINLSFYFEHTQNWQDAGGRWLRHNNFMMELKEECERLQISYSLPAQPYTDGSKQNDAPPEAYNMGDKAGYGLEGLNKRRPFSDEDDDGYKNSPIGHDGSGAHGGNSTSDGSGAAAGAAGAMMFASSM